MSNFATALYQISAIKELERLANIEQGLSEDELMSRAGEAAFQILRERWPNVKQIAVFCGKGNNAGDGYIVARLAKKSHLAVTIYQLAAISELKGPALNAAKLCEEDHVPMQAWQPGSVLQADVIIDAILGTGVTGNIGAPYAAAINAINETRIPVLALDIPSGLNADTGKVMGTAVHAAVTVTFIGLKPGLFTGEGADYSGEVVCDELGLALEVLNKVPQTASLLADGAKLKESLNKRSRNAHKGHYGHVLVIGGDFGMAGAVRMAGEAAGRVGAGLISVATRPEHIAIVSTMRPEIMAYGINDAKDLGPLLEKANTLVLGPGLGQSSWSKQLYQVVLASNALKVFDADALNILSTQPIHRDDWILTPHPGEAARLLNTNVETIQQDRLTAAKAIVKQYGGVCILKGSGTIVCAAEELSHICAAGNPGMASGGMGDVLSGVLGGLMAQGLTPWCVAKCGVYVHAHAADRAALEGGERGLLAMDLMPYLQRMVNPS